MSFFKIVRKHLCVSASVLLQRRETDCAAILRGHEVTLRKTSAAKDDALCSFYRARTMYCSSVPIWERE